MSKARFSKQITWYEQLQEKERARLDIVCAQVLNHAAQALEDLNGETLLRKSFAHEEALPEFYKEEQRRVSELAFSQPLNNCFLHFKTIPLFHFKSIPLSMQG